MKLDTGSTLSDLLIELRQRFPTLAREMDETHPSIIVGDIEADVNLQLQDNMMLHFVWPIAGG